MWNVVDDFVSQRFDGSIKASVHNILFCFTTDSKMLRVSSLSAGINNLIPWNKHSTECMVV